MTRAAGKNWESLNILIEDDWGPIRVHLGTLNFEAEPANSATTEPNGSANWVCKSYVSVHAPFARVLIIIIRSCAGPFFFTRMCRTVERHSNMSGLLPLHGLCLKAELKCQTSYRKRQQQAPSVEDHPGP